MFSNGRKTLIKRLRRGREARRRFVESHLAKGVAFQIRAIRDRQKLSQEELGKLIGSTQNGVSRLESPEYGKPTLTTLRKLAAALDVGLVVRFVPFSQLIDWVSGTPQTDWGLSSESLATADFTEEERLGVFDSARSTGVDGTYDSATLLHVDHGESFIIKATTGDIPTIRKPIGKELQFKAMVATGDFIRREART